MALTIKQINGKIAHLTKSHAKFNDEVQLLLCSIAQYAYEKNVDPATRLLITNPDEKDVKKRQFRFDSVDNTVLIHWIEKHMPARWVASSASFAFNKSFVGEYDAVALMASPWYQKAVKPRQVSSSLDMLDSLRSFIKRQEKEAARVIDGQPIAVEHAEILDMMKAIANKVEYAEKKEA